MSSKEDGTHSERKVRFKQVIRSKTSGSTRKRKKKREPWKEKIARFLLVMFEEKIPEVRFLALSHTLES